MNSYFKVKKIKFTPNELEKIGFDSSYLPVATDKHLFYSFKIQNISCAQANILKQTALSVGTDCAVHREVITGNIEFSDCVLSGSVSEIKKIIKKLKTQPFKLDLLADEINSLLQKEIVKLTIKDNTFSFDKPALMGILNITPDSFSDGGKYNSTANAIRHYKELLKSGASIIDIGGESTRPNHTVISDTEEISRIIPIIKEIRKSDPNTILSVDTRNSKTAEAAINAGIDIINDVSGMQWDKQMMNVVLKHTCPIVLGHAISVEHIPTYDVIDELIDYFVKQTSLLISNGFDKTKIILDPCLGFGKTFEQNCEIIRRVNELKSLKYPILVGHSRKSFLQKLINTKDNDLLDNATVSISQYLISNGVDILRVHNLKKHSDMTKLSGLFI